MAHYEDQGEYPGEMSPDEAWAVLGRDPGAQLVDVRCAAEWAFVGVPDLSSVGRKAHLVQWQIYPEMGSNPDFLAETTGRLREAGAGPDTPVLFLCRSGGRSRAAAKAMARAGFRHAINVTSGFEGDPDVAGHRGTRDGWKAAGLPWRQS